MENKWLNSAIAQGLAGMVLLRLPNQPPEDMIAATAKVWVKVISQIKLYNGWNEQDDKARIEQAFLRLYAECDRFPTPKQFLDRLPPRKTVQALPQPKMTEQQRLIAAERLAQLRMMIKQVAH